MTLAAVMKKNFVSSGGRRERQDEGKCYAKLSPRTQSNLFKKIPWGYTSVVVVVVVVTLDEGFGLCLRDKENREEVLKFCPSLTD